MGLKNKSQLLNLLVLDSEIKNSLRAENQISSFTTSILSLREAASLTPSPQGTLLNDAIYSVGYSGLHFPISSDYTLSFSQTVKINIIT
jgi:hypothetical protein